MGEKRKNPHSDSLWETTKAEAGLVAAATIGGAAVGFGVGTGIVAIAATPPVPTLVISTTSGGVLGFGVGIYAGLRIREAEARAEAYTDYTLRQARIGKLPPVDRDQQLAEAFANAVKPQFEALNKSLTDLPEELVETLIKADGKKAAA